MQRVLSTRISNQNNQCITDQNELIIVSNGERVFIFRLFVTSAIPIFHFISTALLAYKFNFSAVTLLFECSSINAKISDKKGDQTDITLDWVLGRNASISVAFCVVLNKGR